MGTSTGMGSLRSQSSLLQLKEASTLQQMKPAKSLSDAAKIDKGAQQFEAILIGSWLKDAEQSFGSVPGGDDNQDSGGEQMMSLGVQSYRDWQNDRQGHACDARRIDSSNRTHRTISSQ
jgi:hypothetical protein